MVWVDVNWKKMGWMTWDGMGGTLFKNDKFAIFKEECKIDKMIYSEWADIVDKLANFWISYRLSLSDW